MLKRKRELNYRKAKSADLKEYRCCWHCKSIVWTDIFSCLPGVTEPMRQDWRCKTIGVNNGRMYTISINNLCDRFERLIGERK